MDEHVVPTYKRAEPVFVSGRGASLVDEEGREYLDFLSGIAVTALGHAHPRLVAALTDQVGKLTHVSNLLRNPYTEDVAGRIARLAGMQAVFFCNSGSEANETALKIARKVQHTRGVPGRSAFVALEGSFHGRTTGALAVTSTEKYRAPFGPLLEATFVPPEDLDALANALAAKPAALILEPVQGESGLRVLSRVYLEAARELCTATETVLIHDEVQCGAFRTGTFLAGEQSGVVPDVATLAKPIAAGLPMGAAVVSAEFANALEPGDHGSTFGGGPLALRAALVFLEELEEGGLAANVRERGAELAAGLDALAAEFDIVAERRGLGLMQGLRVPGHSVAVKDSLFERGLVACTAGDDVVRLLPPFIITAEDVERGLGILAGALAATR